MQHKNDKQDPNFGFSVLNAMKFIYGFNKLLSGKRQDPDKFKGQGAKA